MFTQQPFRSIYVGLYFLSSICLIPYFIVQNATRSRRPRPSWTLLQAVYVALVRRIVRLMGTGHMGGRVNLDAALPAQSLKHSHPVTIPAVPREYITGKVLEYAQLCGGWDVPVPDAPKKSHRRGTLDRLSVAPRAHPGYWFLGPQHAPPRACPDLAAHCSDGLVYLHFHGGGYAIGTADEHGPAAEISRRLVEETRISAVFAASYRLADAAPFPAALIDAIGSYYYLTRTLGIPAKRILVGGDSAGGNLTLALVRYILHAPPPASSVGERLEPPAGIILMSPRADLTASHHGPGSTAVTNRGSDVLGYSYKLIYGNLFKGYPSQQEMLQSPYVSPAWYGLSEATSGEDSFERWPSTYISAGGGEMLLSEIEALHARMVRTGADDVELDIAQDMPHDFLSLRPNWVWEPEVTRTFERISRWLDRKYAKI